MHLGSPKYPDFLIHQDDARKERYLARAKTIKNRKGEFTWEKPRVGKLLEHETSLGGKINYIFSVKVIKLKTKMNSKSSEKDQVIIKLIESIEEITNIISNDFYNINKFDDNDFRRLFVKIGYNKYISFTFKKNKKLFLV